MKTPRISVIMSCYNAERWLVPAIESVLTQSFRDFEFIVVNDGSLDGTADILNSYANKDERVVVFNKCHSGVSKSRNIALEIARGQWIANIDADDLCLPSRLEKQLSRVENAPSTVLLGSGFVEIDETAKIIKTHRYPADHERLVHRLKRGMAFFPHSSAFFRRDIVRQLGGYRSRIRTCADLDLWFRVAERHRLACSPDALVQIRKHDAQVSHNEGGRRTIIDDVVLRVSFFIRQLGIADPLDATEEVSDHFVAWVEQHIQEQEIIERRLFWIDARKRFFAQPNRMVGVTRFASELLCSGYAAPLIIEKIWGSRVAERLAEQWAAKFAE